MFGGIGIGLRLLGLAVMISSVVLMFAVQVWTIAPPHKVLLATNEFGEHDFEFYGFMVVMPVVFFVTAEYLVLLADKQLFGKQTIS